MSEAASNEVESSEPAPRSGRELIAATKPFQKENRARSWFHVFETFGVMTGLAAALYLVPYWYVRLPLALLQGLVVVRAFILYHDFMHNSLLRGSKLAKLFFYPYGVLVLTPPRSGGRLTTTITRTPRRSSARTSVATSWSPPRCGRT